MSDATDAKKTGDGKKCCPETAMAPAMAPAAATTVGSLLQVATVQIPQPTDYCLVEDGGPNNGKIRVKMRGSTLRLQGFPSPPQTYIAVSQGAPPTEIPVTPTTVASGGLGIAKPVIDATNTNYVWGEAADDSYVYLINSCDLGAPNLVFNVVIWHIYQTPFSRHILIETATFSTPCPAAGFDGCPE